MDQELLKNKIAELEKENEKDREKFNVLTEKATALLEKKQRNKKDATKEAEEEANKIKNTIIKSKATPDQTVPQNTTETETSQLEKNLEQAREKYANEYRKFMTERKKKANFLKNWGRKIFGSKVKDNELPEELKKLEEEYEKATVALGNKLYADKKADLLIQNVSKEETVTELEKFKKVDIFNKIIIDEQLKLNALKAENLPPKEKNILQKAVKWYFSPSKNKEIGQTVGKKATKIAIGMAITGTIVYFFVPGTIVAAGGLASYLAMRGVRAVTGAVVGQLASKGYDLFIKDKTGIKRLKEEGILAEKFNTENNNKEISLEQFKTFKKEHSKILDTEQKRKRNRLIHKTLLSVGLGAGTSLGMSELAHALTPEQVLSGRAPIGHSEIPATREVIHQETIPAEQNIQQPINQETIPATPPTSGENINPSIPDQSDNSNYVAPSPTETHYIRPGGNAQENFSTNPNSNPNITTTETEIKPEVNQTPETNTENFSQTPTTITENPDNTSGEVFGTNPNGEVPNLHEQPVNSPGTYTEEEYALKLKAEQQATQVSTDNTDNTYTENEYALKNNETIKTQVPENSHTGATYTEDEYAIKNGKMRPIKISDENQNTYTEEEYKIKTTEQPTKPSVNNSIDNNEINKSNSSTYTEDEYAIKNTGNIKPQVQENTQAEPSYTEEQYGVKTHATENIQETEGNSGTYTEDEYKISNQENLPPKGNTPDQDQIIPKGNSTTEPTQDNTNPNVTEQSKANTEVKAGETQTQTQTQVQEQTSPTQEHQVDALGHPIEKYIAEGENPYKLSPEQVTKVNDLYEEKMKEMFPKDEENWNWSQAQNYNGIAYDILYGEPNMHYFKITEELKSFMQELQDKTGLKPEPHTMLNSGTTPKEYIMKSLQYAEKNNIKIKNINY